MRAMLDWLRVRAELRSLRFERGLTRNQLQKKSGVEQTTIYRIENTKKLPDHKPDFDSIEALVVAMGLTLSAFFARIEGLKTAAHVSTDPPSSGADHARPVSAADRSADAFIERHFVSALAEEIVGAVDRLVESRTENRTDTHTVPARRRRASSSR